MNLCYHQLWLRPSHKSVKLKIIFIISQPEHMLWVLKRTVSMMGDGSFEHTIHMFRIMGKNIITILRSKIPLIPELIN